MFILARDIILFVQGEDKVVTRFLTASFFLELPRARDKRPRFRTTAARVKQHQSNPTSLPAVWKNLCSHFQAVDESSIVAACIKKLTIVSVLYERR